MDFLFFCLLGLWEPFWTKKGIADAKEVFRKLREAPGLHPDLVWGRGEPWQPRSCPKLYTCYV